MNTQASTDLDRAVLAPDPNGLDNPVTTSSAVSEITASNWRWTPARLPAATSAATVRILVLPAR